MGKPNLHLTLFESTLLLRPVDVPGYNVVKVDLPTRRRISIEEFESDMRAVRYPTPQETGR